MGVSTHHADLGEKEAESRTLMMAGAITSTSAAMVGGMGARGASAEPTEGAGADGGASADVTAVGNNSTGVGNNSGGSPDDADRT